MTKDRDLRSILEAAEAGEAPGRGECIRLLEYAADSLEAGMIRALGDAVSRCRFGGEALLLGQIGVAMAPCDAGCLFCAFAKPHTTIQESTLSIEDAVARAKAFSRGGAAGIFIMTMHHFGFDWFLQFVASLRREIPAATALLANIGDISAAQVTALKDAGLSGAYHVVRLREGIDTRLTRQQRIQTIERVLASGLDWYYSCEPLGPEHTPEEIVDQVFIGLELGCCQHAAMRRFPVPGSPLFAHGQLPLARLAQIVAVISLASQATKTIRSIAVHESNLPGLMSGANALYPEAGEPDHEAAGHFSDADTKEGFSSALWRRSAEITTADCRKMLAEAGFRAIRQADGTSKPLKLEI